MSPLMLELWFRILQLFNSGEPSRQEAFWALNKREHTGCIKCALFYYSNGANLEDISSSLGCTRERVRQMVRKGVRDAHKDRVVLIKD